MIDTDKINSVFQDKFRLLIKDLPTVSFFCRSANIPSISVPVIETKNMINSITYPGNKIDFEDLTVTFKVDENLENYKELFKWMTGLGSPEDIQQFKDLQNDPNRNRVMQQPSQNYNRIFSDATLVTTTNVFNANIKIIFRDMYPISLSGLDFDLASDQSLVASATFKYLNYVIE